MNNIVKLGELSYHEIAASVYNQLLRDSNDSKYIYDTTFCVIGDFDMASSVLKEFMQIDEDDNWRIVEIDLSSPIVEGYQGLYLLSFCGEDIWCSKFYKEDGKPYKYGAEYVFVEEDFLSAAIDNNLNEETKYYVLNYEESQEDGSSFEFITNAEDDNVHGFTFSDEGDGYCYNMRFCFCEDKDVDDLAAMCNEVVKTVTDWLDVI